MKVLILGSGARENALAWKFSHSHRISGLFVAPGNAGCAEMAVNLPLDPCNSGQVIAACRDKGIDLVFVGSEAPLDAGVVDALKAEGIAAVGPEKRCARLESSKVFSKEFMVRNGIPTAAAREFSGYADFETYVKTLEGSPFVVKKSGLAAGKGVLETQSVEEALSFGQSVLKDDKLLVEEFLTGFEISVFVLSDGRDYAVLPPTADFKKAKESDQGPNTGGMGAICPVPTVTQELWKRILDEVVEPTMRGLNKDGLNYTGVIFIGVMVTSSGPRVLEYNVRFGDPETQVLLPLIQSDFGNLAEAMVKGRLASFPLEISKQAALGVVVAAQGYPGPYAKNVPVSHLPEENQGRFILFHANTVFGEDGRIETEGGRCFTCVGVSDDHFEAQKRAYRGADTVRFPGAWFRKDIGEKFFR